MLLERIIGLTTGAVLSLMVGVGMILTAQGVTQPLVETAMAFAPGLFDQPHVDLSDKGAARQRVETILAQTPEYALFFARLREKFTADYEAMIGDFSARLAEKQEEQNADYYLSEAMRRLRLAHGELAAKAQPQPMAAVFEKQLDVLRAAGLEDKRMCVAFLYGASNEDFQRFAAPRRALVAAMALVGLEAIVNGASSAIKRDPPTEADLDMLERALAGRGLGRAEIDALLDGKMPDPPLDDARMCGAGQTYFEVLKTLPEPARTKVYGLALELMAKS